MSDENVVTMKVPENSAPTISHGGRQFAVSKDGLIKCKPSDVEELKAHGLIQVDGPDGKPVTQSISNFATKQVEDAKAAALAKGRK